jgi:uncharacterized protein (TIGR00661 family)
MRFVFLVQGEGRGHMTQAIALQQHLAAAGHTVAGVLIGKNAQRKIPEFFYEKIKAPIETFLSPNFIRNKKNNGVRLFHTAADALKKIPEYKKSLKFIDAKIKDWQPDMIINFYEPLAGIYYFFYHPKIKAVCIGHQYLALHPKFKFPHHKPLQKFLYIFFTNLTAYGATAKLALSFKNWSNIDKKNLLIAPPLLRAEIKDVKISDDNFLLTYLLIPGYAHDIISWQQKNQDQKISIFCDQTKNEWPKNENLTFNDINDIEFLKQLGACSGYLSTAGFESICEAAYLGKPIFVVPTKKHYEQECNAIDIRKAGLGLSADKFNLSDFVPHLNSQKNNNQFQFKNWVDEAPTKFIEILENLK